MLDCRSKGAFLLLRYFDSLNRLSNCIDCCGVRKRGVGGGVCRIGVQASISHSVMTLLAKDKLANCDAGKQNPEQNGVPKNSYGLYTNGMVAACDKSRPTNLGSADLTDSNSAKRDGISSC